jgi:hypothetical protein
LAINARSSASLVVAGKAGGGRGLALVADVDLARGIVADEDGTKAGREACLRFEFCGCGRDIGDQTICARLTVDPFGDDHCCNPVYPTALDASHRRGICFA